MVSDDLVVRFINKVEDEDNLIRNNANARALYRIRKGIDPLVNVQLVKISESNRERMIMFQELLMVELLRHLKHQNKENILK